MPANVPTIDEFNTLAARVTALEATAADHESRITALEGGSPPPPAPTASLTATPQSITAGQSATLEWTTANAGTVTLDGASVPAGGTQVVTPAADQTYTLVASGAGGTVTVGVTVTVSAARRTFRHPARMWWSLPARRGQSLPIGT